MTLETKRLQVREFVVTDLDELQEILGDEMVMEYMEPVYDKDRTQKFLEEFCIGRKGALACVLQDSDKLIGYILFHAVENGVYEMGWLFHKNYWRKGYAFEACKAVMEYGFKELKAHKIFAETIDSVKSVGLMKKLGMTQEGVLRTHTRDNKGNWADFYVYGVLEEEFPMWEKSK